VFTACDDRVLVLRRSDGQVQRELPGDTTPILAFAVSPDDNLLVTSNRSRMIKVWNWRTGECVRQFKVRLAV
jgi:WD40 repeat protein